MRPLSTTNRWLLSALWAALVGVYVVGLRFGLLQIERDLTARARAALGALQLDEIGVDFTGREARLMGTAADPDGAAKAAEVIAALDGVRSVVSAVTVRPRIVVEPPPPPPEPVEAAPAPDEAASAAAAEPTVELQRVGDSLFFKGRLPKGAHQAALAAIAKVKAGGRVGVAIELDEALPERPWAAQIWTLLPAIVEAPGVGFRVQDGALMLTGEIDDPARREGLAAAAAAVIFDLRIDNRIVVVGGG